MSLFAYPYPSYEPNPILAGCVAGVVFISLMAWLIQSCQTRFQPRRLSILLLISHLTIFVELVVLASTGNEVQTSRILSTVLLSLFAMGQRMIIVSNYSFVLEIHHERSCFSRGSFVGAVLGVITSGILMAPANIYAYDPDRIDTSLLFRQLSAAVLLLDTLFFYLIFYLSKTIRDMKREGVILIFTSSVLCLLAAIFNLVQTISLDSYNRTNSAEGWFYGFQLTPIILAHYTWSILHPKRSLTELCLLPLLTKQVLVIDDQQSAE